MTHPVSHLVRDFAVVTGAILALGVAGLVLVGYGFALAIVLMSGAAALLIVPFVAIYYEERDLPRDGRPRRL